MNRLWRDVVTSFRSLSRRPGFSALVVATLALGIGANAAIFSVINAVLFRPLPVPDETRLVFLREFRSDQPNDGGGVSYLDFADWRAGARSFASMSIVTTDESTVIMGETPARLRGAVVSANLFSTLGVSPALGRAFVAEEDTSTPLGLAPLMLAHSTWRERFGSDPAVLGRTVIVDERPFEIVGVAPRDLFPLETEPVQYFVTTAVNGHAEERGSVNGSRGYRAYDGVLARLAPGATLESARAELDTVNRAVRAANPKSDQKLVARATPLREILVGDASERLWLLLGVVGLVLMIACVNVANLLLTRAASREREVAIRFAIGASRGDVARQMIAESGLLALGGAVAGLAVSVWLVRGIVAFLPDGVPRLTGLTPDVSVLMFTGAVAATTAILCGLFPALAATRSSVASAIKEGGRSLGHDPVRGKLRSALVVFEVALAMTLLVGAGLLVNSLLRLNRVDPGFESRGTLTAKLVLTARRYQTEDFKPDRLNQFLDALSERARALPGVVDVSYAQSVPLTGVENNTNFDIVGRPKVDGIESSAQLRFIGADYFRVLGIKVTDGRTFAATDRPGATAVAIVNEAFARAHFGSESPIGRQLKLGWGGDEPKEIVGVVGDVRHRSLADETRPEMYVPQAQFPNAGVTLLVRTEGVPPESLAGPLAETIRALDPQMPLGVVRTLDGWRQATLAVPRFNTALLGGLAALALILTVVGLYGVMSYGVAQRSREMGLRMAIGAEAKDVLKLVIGEGMALVGLGVAIGALAALGLTRLMASLLYGVTPTDAPTFVAIAAILGTVSALACFVPARRATRVDPMTALRCD